VFYFMKVGGDQHLHLSKAGRGGIWIRD